MIHVLTCRRVHISNSVSFSSLARRYRRGEQESSDPLLELSEPQQQQQ